MPSPSSGSGPVAVPNPSTRRPSSRCADATDARSASGNSSGAPSTYRTPPMRRLLHRRREANGTISSPGSAARGYAVEIAARVAFLDSNEAAKPPSASSRPAVVVPAAGTSSRTRRDGVVSVPVLSMQSVSTDASDSIAFSCCDRAPARAMRSAAAAYVNERSRIRPSGMSVTIPATAVSTAWRIPTSCFTSATISMAPRGIITPRST